ncbi:MAG: sulfite exporter TauE/SafE family protein, partial [Bifidobacterium bifidum]
MTENDGQDRLFGPNPSGLDESPHGMMVLVIVGMIVGLLSGMFGIGGGTVIVPVLVWLGLSQRHAAATSMLAIVPTSISGVISYATCGNVDWLAALLLFCGMFVGGQIGSWLLSRLPELVLRWIFVVFLVFVVFNQI